VPPALEVCCPLAERNESRSLGTLLQTDLADSLTGPCRFFSSLVSDTLLHHSIGLAKRFL
jgi:hypothetical protein